MTCLRKARCRRAEAMLSMGRAEEVRANDSAGMNGLSRPSTSIGIWSAQAVQLWGLGMFGVQ